MGDCGEWVGDEGAAFSPLTMSLTEVFLTGTQVWLRYYVQSGPTAAGCKESVTHIYTLSFSTIAITPTAMAGPLLGYLVQENHIHSA